MRRKDSGFSIVDMLIIMALLLIVVGMVGPHFAKSRSQAGSSSPTTAAPVRPAR